MRLQQFGARNFLIAVHDLLATATALLGAVYLRLDGGPKFFQSLPHLLQILPAFLALTAVACFAFKLTTAKWRFFSLPDAIHIFQVASLLTLALLILDYVLVAPNVFGGYFLGKVTLVLYWFLEIFFLSALRITYRYFRYTRVRRHAKIGEATPTLLVGRAADAEVVLRGIESGAIKGIWPAGILSPSAADHGQLVRGLPVLGGTDDIEEVIAEFGRRKKGVGRIVMTPSAFEVEAQPETTLMRARRLGLVVNRLPSLDTGEAPRLASVRIEDLLLRPTAQIDYAQLEKAVRGKKVIVTGGGGSIGSEICERLVSFGAERLLIIENSEPALYAVSEVLEGLGSKVIIEGRIADVRDREQIKRLMTAFRPDLVFHAAALKHVPILERDSGEAVKTNIFGSVNVADAAVASGAKLMVMVSTDKAIEPVSMLGLTKRFAEMYCQALDHDLNLEGSSEAAGTRLISVRFGNVLGSNGSVVPKFKSQIAAGGPVTVTHPDMIRYFMTIREACDLVITACAHSLAAERSDVSVYVLNMGQPVKIVELAERMIRLSGLEPGHDMEVVFTGIRPGERLNEILFASEEPTIDIGISGVMAAKPNQPAMLAIKRWMAILDKAIAADDWDVLRKILEEAVPEFNSSSTLRVQA
ncbi:MULTISPECIES: SDR family NAD(P)-dependent oxidoreductase [Bradyrhizobium]|uniref:Capsular biosynthesis protein n=1 Tax=Bradyrhizobium canariense TaxID=255045 RepID=A0ABX3X366_9BRAD|nr:MULTISPECIES: SDR family NAD(P)-dependent oxidoreductase [Bradyrhizobium]MCK1438328.1 polysaccharide biosynthesis protein [Bradyrhizobium sp. 15]OSJ14111.1 capsular biosynthesis protein [Bradyrhizobium canariense]OSJ28054.1 capsular biosynthesis protein [Bradyrhizobium canariense]